MSIKECLKHRRFCVLVSRSWATPIVIVMVKVKVSIATGTNEVAVIMVWIIYHMEGSWVPKHLMVCDCMGASLWMYTKCMFLPITSSFIMILERHCIATPGEALPFLSHSLITSQWHWVVMEMLICVFIISFRSVSEGDLDRMSGSVFVQNEMLN